MKAANYLRVSTERQDEANQEPECLRLTQARGWEPVIFRERESGAKDRAEWSRVLDAARRGEVRAVVIWSLDRVGRRMFQVINDVRELHRYGCVVVSVRESWLDTSGPASSLLLAIFGWVAEHERERLRERTSAGLARARAQGQVLGPPRVLPVSVANIARGLRAEGTAKRRSWAEVRSMLILQGHGTFGRTSIATAVSRLSRKGAQP